MNGINIIGSNVNLFINSTQVKKVRSQNYNIDKLYKFDYQISNANRRGVSHIS